MIRPSRHTVLLPLSLFAVLVLVPRHVLGQDTPMDTAAIADIATRTEELNKADDEVSDNELVIFEEMRQVNDDIARYQALRRELEDGWSGVNFDSLRTVAAPLLQRARALDCASPGAAAKSDSLYREIRSITNTVFSSYPGTRTDDPWSEFRRVPGQILCEELRSRYGEDSKSTALMAYFDILKRDQAQARQQVVQSRQQIEKLLTLLQNRRATLQEALSNRSTQQELGDKLWLTIGVIGLLSLAAIVAVKLFPEPLQLEWVSSGQVIQFVTVMILLSVIMALGLAGILKENTLGTLLGGIAGYVLSQGVGRAAAREARRSVEEHSPPPSPQAPAATIQVPKMVAPPADVAPQGNPPTAAGSTAP
jgi:hypothetical protein